MFAYIKFLCDNICLNRVAVVSPYTGFAVISLFESVTNLTFFDAIWFKTGPKTSFRTFQKLKNKLDKRVGIIDFGEFSSLFLESLSAVTSMQYVIFMKKNKSGSSVNELQYS